MRSALVNGKVPRQECHHGTTSESERAKRPLRQGRNGPAQRPSLRVDTSPLLEGGISRKLKK